MSELGSKLVESGRSEGAKHLEHAVMSGAPA